MGPDWGMSRDEELGQIRLDNRHQKVGCKGNQNNDETCRCVYEHKMSLHAAVHVSKYICFEKKKKGWWVYVCYQCNEPVEREFNKTELMTFHC